MPASMVVPTAHALYAVRVISGARSTLMIIHQAMITNPIICGGTGLNCQASRCPPPVLSSQQEFDNQSSAILDGIADRLEGGLAAGIYVTSVFRAVEPDDRDFRFEAPARSPRPVTSAPNISPPVSKNRERGSVTGSGILMASIICRLEHPKVGREAAIRRLAIRPHEPAVLTIVGYPRFSGNRGSA